MNHRERVLTSLNHEEPDKVPVDCGGRQVDFVLIVAVPVFPGDGEGVVGMGEGRCQEKRTVVLVAGEIVDFLHRCEAN